MQGESYAVCCYAKHASNLAQPSLLSFTCLKRSAAREEPAIGTHAGKVQRGAHSPEVLNGKNASAHNLQHVQS